MFGGGGFGGGIDYSWYNEPEEYYIGARQQSAGMSFGGGGFGGWGGFGGFGGWGQDSGTQTQGGQTGPTNWFMIFFKQKEFRNLVLDRVNLMVAHLDEINAYIDYYSKYLNLSYESNQQCSTYDTSDTHQMNYKQRMEVIKTFHPIVFAQIFS